MILVKTLLDRVLTLVGEDGKIPLDGTDENTLDEFNQMISPDGSENVVCETQRVFKPIEPEKKYFYIQIPRIPKLPLTTSNK